MNLRRVIPVGLILLGMFWCFESIFTYQLWVRNGPGGGFISLIAGIITMAFSVLILVQEWRENHQETRFDPMVLLPIGYMVAIALLTQLIGLILALTVYSFLWLKIREKKPVVTCVLVAVICPAVLYALFVLWLRAPLPKGLLGLI